MSHKLKIATVQHPVGHQIKNNLNYMRKYMLVAANNEVDIVHFPECNLSGYAGLDFTDYAQQDPSQLENACSEIASLAGQLAIWVVFGTHHFVKNQAMPFNSLFIINSKGEQVDRYDKRHLTQAPETDYLYYHPGYRPVIFDLNGRTCALLICHEWRYPEFYRAYAKEGVQLIFQSFYDGGQTKKQFEESGRHLGDLIQGAMKGNAANNYCWISASNTCKPESSYPSFVLRPDGRLSGKLSRNKTGMLITSIDFNDTFSDPSKYWRGKMGLMH